MANNLLHWNSWISTPTREKLNKSQAYRYTRYAVVGLLVSLAIFTLMGAWWLNYSDSAIVINNNNPAKSFTQATNTFVGELHRTPSSSLYQADLAFGILGIILAVAILGTRKQPFNIALFSLGLLFIVILIALISVTYDTVVIVRVFAPATITGV